MADRDFGELRNAGDQRRQVGNRQVMAGIDGQAHGQSRFRNMTGQEQGDCSGYKMAAQHRPLASVAAVTAAESVKVATRVAK